MQYNFDKLIDRRGTNSLKYDFAAERGMPADVLPLWVADMDFAVPSCITDALHARVSHGIFGYSDTKEDYFTVLHTWFLNHFNWDVKASWLLKTPGIVFAIYTAIRAFTQKGDAILTADPVYYPFHSAVLDTERTLVVSTLCHDQGKYTMDFDDIEEKIIANHVKLFILCNPHNPVGRVWTREELLTLAEICMRHGVLVISDEIHADFVYAPHKHTVFASLSPEISDITITCTSPGKTFNIAGLHISNIFISNPKLYSKMQLTYEHAGLSQPSIFGFIACQAAYEHGDAWLSQLRSYIYDNLNYIHDFLSTSLPKASFRVPEGTYLAWIDLRGTGLSPDEIQHKIVHEAKLWLDDGRMFGQGGDGFQRINAAAPRQTIQEALCRLKDTFAAL